MAKTVIVTGASRGLGLAIARQIVNLGHNVVVTARSQSALESFRNEKPTQIRAVAGDITDPTLAIRIVDTAKAAFGQVSGVIVNQGIMEPVARIADGKAEEWRRCFDVNLISVISLLEAAIPPLRETEGRIVFTSSGAARHSYAAWGAYGASKAALKSLGDTLAVEEPKIVAISMEPGTVDTDMQRDIREKHAAAMDEKDRKRFLGLPEQGKLLKPEEPGNVMARLVLDAPKELSGQALRWDAATLEPYRDR